jgi:hypothetical protein
MKKSTRSCCFKEQFTKEQVDPRVKQKWEDAYGRRAPFGNLRQMWVRQHCRIVAPYDDCPYDKQDCALAFLTCVELVTEIHRTSPTGYFRAAARTLALKRADEKPLARSSTVVQEGPRHPRDADGHLQARQGMRRDTHRPIAIGDVLGSFDFGPREDRGADGKEGTK